MTAMREPHDSIPRPGWALVPVDEGSVAALAQATGVSRVTARILLSRGLEDADAVERFFTPSLERDWIDPLELPDMDRASRVVAAAVRDGKRIVVFGDFDLDGISATAILALGLRELGGRVRTFIPSRFGDGYGLSATALERVLEEPTDLIVTVDCGVASGDEVETLLDRGVEVVVTDHHEPSGEVPKGIPVVDPKVDPSSPSQALSGAGVALKLLQAVGALLGSPALWRAYTDLATLGTVADLMPLVGENRALVADGVRRITADPRPGIKALCSVAGVDPREMTSESISFSLSPRLNAAGRMGDPEVALDALMTLDDVEAEDVVRRLDEMNRERQHLEADLSEAALALADRTWSGERAIVVWDEGWHEGVKGIVASRLVNRFGVPSFLFTVEDGVAHGSGRSIPGIDLFEAVTSFSHLLTRYGGHTAAVGVTLPAADLEAFRESLVAYLADLPEEQFHPPTLVEAVVKLDDLSAELVAELDLLRPYGQANRAPLLLTDCVFMTARRRVGRLEDHLRFTAYDGIAEVPAIAFRCKDIERFSDIDRPVDIGFELSLDEWRGRARLQMVVRSLTECRHSEDSSPAAAFVDDLFERADEFLAREAYAGITEEPSFNTKLVGVTFEGRQDRIAALDDGMPLRLQRQPENPYDANAVAAYAPDGIQIGYLNRNLSGTLAPVMDAGVEYDAAITAITGGEEGRPYGVNVLVSRRDLTDPSSLDEETAEYREELADLPQGELRAALVERFIGDNRLHEAQSRTLDLLAARKSVLTVMATGRGKSLIFHLHAAEMALAEKKASVFVFPLRALVADQAYHLAEVFSKMGIAVRTITGESSATERDEGFAALGDGELDVVLTTPEFLQIHAERFADSGRIGFLVVDEAHHIALSRAGHRPAYTMLGQVRERLGSPVTLAVTATADTAAARAISDELGIDEWVLDPSVRENLMLDDRRDFRDKDDYLTALANRGEKAVIYVNSREQTVRLAKMLRKRVPQYGHRIAFYHGGLGRSIRNRIEQEFRAGEIRIAVSTSAFGEGVNIPDIRHVVLFHQPFNSVEFNQMSGRAGRDGAPATIHLLFGARDARINELILSSAAPGRPDMAALYRALRALQEGAGPAFEVTNAELVDRATRIDPNFSLDERGVSSGIGILRELELLTSEGYGAGRRITLVPTVAKVDLESSARYLEGLEELKEFADFKEWVYSATAGTLLQRFNRPILPEGER